MKVVVTCTNFIKKYGLNHRQFKELCEDLESEYGDLIFYTEVRWLSRGKMLRRFYEMRKEIELFMEIKEKPIPELNDDEWICDLAFLVDLTTHLNQLNSNLQAKGKLIHELYFQVTSFTKKLKLWESQLKTGQAVHFPTLNLLNKKNNFDNYAKELQSISKEFTTRFEDFRKKDSLLEIFHSPMDFNVENAPDYLQLDLIEFQSNLNFKSLFKSMPLLEFYQTTVTKEKFPEMSAFVARMMSLFGSTYLCEQLFSLMKYTKSPIRSSMSNTNLQHAMRLATTSIQPKVEVLAKDMQYQKSH